eukprot:scaffold60291_cov22-Cyclotella_meneghiniana.AAC.1
MLLSCRAVIRSSLIIIPRPCGRLKCSTCKQYWTGSTLTLMGKECAEFVSKKHPEDKYLKLAALVNKQSSILRSSVTSLEDLELASNEVLSAIEELTGDVQSASRLQIIHRATYGAAYGLGHVAFRRKEPELAIEFFTKSLDCLRFLGHGDDDAEVIQKQWMIAKAERLLPDADIAASKKKILQLLRSTFEKMIEEEGENSSLTLWSGFNLAKELNRQNQLNEAKELFDRLHPKTCRVLGSHHNLARNIERLMESISRGDV